MSLTRSFLPLSLLTCWLSLTAFGAEIRGTVLGPDGTPLAKTPVRIFDRPSYADDAVPTDLQTDDNGVFVFETKSEIWAGNGQTLTAVLTVPGLAAQSMNLVTGDNEIQTRAGKKWDGIVLDEAQKPVAGATVRFWRWNEGFEGYTFPKEQTPQAVSGADGHFILDNVPTTGQVTLGITDPRFVANTFVTDASAAEAPPLFVKPGATISGRIVTSDGQPMTGLQIVALSNTTIGGGSPTTKSAADGSFSISGVKAGDVVLQANSESPDWGLKYLTVRAVKPGETRAVPDWVANKRMEVTGQVVDAATKKPLEGMDVQLYSSGMRQQKTDATGHFKVKTLAPDFGSVEGYSYIGKSLDDLSVPKDAKTYDIGTIELQQGVEFHGTAIDEKGNDIPFFEFVVRDVNREGLVVRGLKGKFAMTTMAPGSYKLDSDVFEVVSPKTVELQLNKPNQNFELVLRTKEIKPQMTLIGRVVDGTKQPVAGAFVSYKAGQYRDRTVVSGTDGQFHIPMIERGAQPTLIGIERPGFVFSSGGATTQADALWQAEVVMTPSGQMFKGRVVDAKGQPVAGAWVTVIGDKNRQPVLSDAAGDFALRDLPASEVTLGAAQGLSYGQTKVSGNAKNTVLTLEAPAPVDATALANETLAGNVLPFSRSFIQFRPILGDDRLETIALRGDKVPGMTAPGQGSLFLQAIFTDLSINNPQRLVARGPQLMQMFPAGGQWNASVMLARAQAQIGDLEQKQAAKAWFDGQKKVQRGINAASVTQYLSMAAVASDLKLNEADSWTDFALTIAAQLSEKDTLYGASAWGATAATISPATLDQLLGELKPAQQLVALGGAVQALAQRGDVENAALLLAKMQPLRTDVVVIKVAQTNAEANRATFDPDTTVMNAEAELARALASRDAPAAWKLAQGITNYKRNATMLIVADGAHRSGHDEIATQALRAIFATDWADPALLVQSAALANLIDPKLGAELFATTRDKVAAVGVYGDRASIAEWAFYHAPLDTALSRVLLESEWATRLTAPKDTKTGMYDPNMAVMARLAWAMSAVDPKRALEMAEVAPYMWGGTDSVKTRIATALLTTPEQRVTYEIGAG